MIEALTEGAVAQVLFEQPAAQVHAGRYCLQVAIGVPEEGLIPAWCPTLPGVVSQGRTEDEAVANIKEALIGALSEYRESKMPIPWVDDADPQEGETRRWVWVDVQ